MAITIVVEDGTGLPNANTYVDAAFVAQYAEQMGSDLWCDNTSKQSVALIQSAAFMDMRYASWYPGVPLTTTQGLLYPRRFVGQCVTPGAATGIPLQLKKAQAALALQYLANDGVLDLNANATNMIKQQAVSVGNGAVSESITYFAPIEQSAYSVPDALIKQLSPVQNNGMFLDILRGQ